MQKTKWFLKVIIILLLLCLQSHSSGEANSPELPIIAVANYTNHSGSDLLKEENAVTDYLIDQFVNSGRFIVCEREAMNHILNEHNIQFNGNIDSSTAIKSGRLLGIKYLIYGSVTNVSTKTEVISYEENSVNTNKVMANITGRMIDIETGRIVVAATGKGTSKSSKIDSAKHKITIGTVDVTQESVHNCLEKAAENLVYNLLKHMDK